MAAAVRVKDEAREPDDDRNARHGDAHLYGKGGSDRSPYRTIHIFSKSFTVLEDLAYRSMLQRRCSI